MHKNLKVTYSPRNLEATKPYLCFYLTCIFIVLCTIIIEKNTFYYVCLPLGSLDVVVVSVLI